MPHPTMTPSSKKKKSLTEPSGNAWVKEGALGFRDCFSVVIYANFRPDFFSEITNGGVMK
jgi:hypothetical protein